MNGFASILEKSPSKKPRSKSIFNQVEMKRIDDLFSSVIGKRNEKEESNNIILDNKVTEEDNTILPRKILKNKSLSPIKVLKRLKTKGNSMKNTKNVQFKEDEHLVETKHVISLLKTNKPKSTDSDDEDEDNNDVKVRCSCACIIF
jgi:hypothetical protein